MALAPLFAWPGDIQPLAILGQTCPLPSCGEPRFCLVTGHLRFPLVGTNFVNENNLPYYIARLTIGEQLG